MTFRLYEPISCQDAAGAGRLMALHRWICRGIALTVLLIGLALFPFLETFVKDVS